MKVIETIPAFRQWQEGQTAGMSGFVPTMGALHEGHLSLVRRARKENDRVLASIYVNPIQFNNPEDLAKYPRTPEADLAMLEKAGCDAVFMPDDAGMYPEPVRETWDFGPLGEVLEGKFRPGHFSGVATVVKRLFLILRPDRAYFGEKDYQQLLIVRKMTAIAGLPVTIVACPTVREPDGLAMSSRNRRLSAETRPVVPVIFRTLAAVSQKPNGMSPEECSAWAINQIEAQPGLKVEYFAVVDAETLRPAGSWDESRRLVACTAVWADNVRLIDNMPIL